MPDEPILDFPGMVRHLVAMPCNSRQDVLNRLDVVQTFVLMALQKTREYPDDWRVQWALARLQDYAKVHVETITDSDRAAREAAVAEVEKLLGYGG